MNDILWNPILRDLPLTANGDLQINTNPSTQNGTIILESRCAILLQPQVGIGYNNQVLGGNIGDATFELNRCVSQIQADNGNAAWKSIPPPPNVQFDFEISVNYPQ